MKELKYSEIVRLNRELGETIGSMRYDVSILSNTMTSQFNDILEYVLRSSNINCKSKSGNYDNIVQDSLTLNESNLVIIFWELANLIDGFQYKANLMSNEELDTLIEKTKSEISTVFANLANIPLVILNKFSSLIFGKENIGQDNFDRACSELNRYLQNNLPSNFILIDTDKILADISVEKSVDFRYFYSSKTLYSVLFFRRYAEYIKPLVLSVHGFAKKALVFDCDNTIWKGIIGEDGFDGIKMSSRDFQGVIFHEIQSIALALRKKGILLGICSKNNPQDVDNVLSSHPDMVLRPDDFVIKKINWNDKVTNLLEIAKELNIGLDSIVFVDDSDFELNLVREQLPQVAVAEVPKILSNYPGLFRKNINFFFYTGSQLKEDADRSAMYHQEVARKTECAKFADIKDYLKSLELKMRIYRNDKSIIPRIAQLTQKTNQFNLTTKRYTETEIACFIEDKKSEILAFDASDKFGNYGITGLAILKFNIDSKTAEIDTFLMSCRIIGRNMEFAFFDFIIDKIRRQAVVEVIAEYKKTKKNGQVEEFYKNMGFSFLSSDGNVVKYRLKTSEYISKNIEFVKVECGN